MCYGLRVSGYVLRVACFGYPVFGFRSPVSIRQSFIPQKYEVIQKQTLFL